MMLIACVFVRVFQTGSLIDRVFKTYNLMHTNQTLDFVKQKVSTSVACEIQPSVINSLSTSTLRFFRYIWLLIYVIFACVMQPYYWPRLCNFSRTKSHWFCNFCVFCGCLFCCGRLSDLVRLSKQILSFEVKQTRTDGLSVSTKCVTNLTKFADAHCSVFVYVTWSGSSAPMMFRELCMILECAVNS